MTETKQRHLTVYDHDRDAAGMTYVYPVVSRRAGGVSLGINLNPNNACNWQCIYCQVPDLTRGVAPDIDVEQLTAELRSLLSAIVHGDYLEKHVDPSQRRLVDIAFSGNGEPTTCKRFDAVVGAVLDVVREYDLLGKINFVVISNGSMVARPEVRAGLRALGDAGGELWFKIDAGDKATREAINQVPTPDGPILDNLTAASALLRMRIQTCVFELDGEAPADAWVEAYLDLLHRARERGARIHDILLYGLARESMQAAANRLSPLPVEQLHALADRLRAGGFDVSAHG